MNNFWLWLFGFFIGSIFGAVWCGALLSDSIDVHQRKVICNTQAIERGFQSSAFEVDTANECWGEYNIMSNGVTRRMRLPITSGNRANNISELEAFKQE